jgi:hypothetical protein
MTFLAPSFWMNLASKVIHKLDGKEGWDPSISFQFIHWMKSISCLTGCDAWQRKRQTRRCTSRLRPNSDSRKHNLFAPNPSHQKITQSKNHFWRQNLVEHRSAFALLWGEVLLRRLGGTIDRWSCTRGLHKRNRSVPGVRFVRGSFFWLAMAREVVNVNEYEILAKDRMPKMAYDYFASGAEDQVTLRDNRDAFSRIKCVNS